MFKNKTAQIVLQTVYCTIGVIGIFASVGFFNYSYRPDWFVHFTNLSNYICIGIMFAELIQTIRKEADSYVSVCPMFKFMGNLMILLTFFTFNFLLAGDRDMALNFQVSSVCFHVVLPILFVVDWFLFYERKQIKWYAPLVSTGIPLVYLAFVYVRAWLLDYNREVPYLYPYFFLDVDKIGVAGVFQWVMILLVAFIVMGYLFFGIDRLLKSR